MARDYKEIAENTYDFCNIPLPKTKEEYLIYEDRFMKEYGNHPWIQNERSENRIDPDEIVISEDVEKEFPGFYHALGYLNGIRIGDFGLRPIAKDFIWDLEGGVWPPERPE